MMFFRPRGHSRNQHSSRSRSAQHNNPRRRASRALRVESLERRELLAITPQALLPDLTPWANQAKSFIYGWTIVGNDLRLTTAMANIGTGAMELRGGATHADETQDVYQRVFEPNGTFTDVLAGTFTYHPEHGHIHFDEFAQFRLRQVLPDGGVGDIVAAGDKVSFCLLDVERYNTSGPGSPHYLNCGQIQGISVGWADVYDRGLEGQSIEITNVPNGNYWLEVVVDPDNHIIESNENNNVTRIQIALQRPTGGGGIAPDAFEPNNSFDAASILAPPEDHTYSNLSIHASTNADFYRVTASASGPMAFRLAFLNSQGDVDMEVFDSTRTRIGRSDSGQNSEQVSLNAVAGQFYYVRVYGFNGATNPNYTFTVDQPEGVSGGAPDQFEDNDTFATARSLAAVDQSYTNLNINTSGDDDYYKITPTASGTMTVNLAFVHTQGDIDLEILNASQARLGISDSTSNSEQVSLQVTAGQTYYIWAYGYHGATNSNYSMAIDVPTSGVIPPDAFEENDTVATARSLAALDQAYANLNIDKTGDDDFYKIVPAASGMLNLNLAFQNAQGNVDMQILNSAQVQLGLSASTANSEQLSVPVTAGQTYYVRVYGFQGAVNANYTMTVDVPSASGITPDTLEENDTMATARSLSAVSQTFQNLSIDATGDDDYYRIVPTTTGIYSFSLAFVHASGDIDMDVLNSTGTRLGRSESTGNSEQLNVNLTAGQTYYIRAFGYQGAVNPNYSLTIGVPGSSVVTYLSNTSSGTLSSTDGSPSLTVANSDIFMLSVQSSSIYGYRMQLDGSDVGLTTSSEDIDAFVFLPDGSIVISTVGAFSVPGTGGTTISGSGEDLLRFVPTSLGDNTAGTWSMYFDGSDVGLSGSNENIDAVAVLADGRILISTTGTFSVNGGVTGEDEDLIAFTPTSLGATTAGTWAIYFDGSDVGLNSNDGEDVNGLYVRETGGSPTLYLSTVGNFSVTGVSGANEDVVAFTPTTLGANTTGTFASVLALDGSIYGLSSFDVDGIYLVPPTGGAQALVQRAVVPTTSDTILLQELTASTLGGRKGATNTTAGSMSASTNTLLLTTVSSPTTATSMPNTTPSAAKSIPPNNTKPALMVATPVVQPIGGSSGSSKKAKKK